MTVLSGVIRIVEFRPKHRCRVTVIFHIIIIFVFRSTFWVHTESGVDGDHGRGWWVEVVGERDRGRWSRIWVLSLDRESSVLRVNSLDNRTLGVKGRWDGVV